MKTPPGWQDGTTHLWVSLLETIESLSWRPAAELVVSSKNIYWNDQQLHCIQTEVQ